MTQQAMELSPGAVFADHEIRALVGRGGMGVVYRALHLPLAREVALKLIVPELSADSDFRERFKRESRVAASLEHPHAIPIYHASESDGLLYITMRFVEGTDLRQQILERGALPPQEVCELATQIAGALHAAHQLGIVHRDVKPANILIGGSTGRPHAYLTDFGLTKQADAEDVLTRSGMIMGSFDYIAPEQLEGRPVDARTDVYAMGCVIYEALTGDVPYPRDTGPAKLFAHIAAPPPSVLEARPDLPPALDELVRTAMAKDPDERYASAAELADALQAAVASSPRANGTPPASVLPVPLPPQLRPQAGEEPFVGRSGAFAQLRAAFERAGERERGLVLLSGEPGVGKSRLARELARHAHAHGATALFGSCDEEPIAPFQPFTEAGRYYLAQSPEMGQDLGPIARLVPEMRAHMEPDHELPGAPETERYQLFDAVARLVVRVAEQRPLVLVLDDVHWADKPTMLMLRYLFERTAGEPVLLVCTARDLEAAQSAAFGEIIGPLRRLPGFERIALDGFDEAETASLVAGHAGGEPSPALVRRIREQTGGNPFFIEEMLRAADGPLSEAALDRMPVPEGVKELIGRRLAGLDEATRRVLGLAAVVGRNVPVTVLEALADDDVLSALEAAEAAGLVVESRDDVDSFTFSHALVREVLYEQPSTSRRVRLHRRVGEVLEAQTAPNVAELSHHFYEARHVGGAEKAVEYALAAAEQAARSVAYEEASGHYRRALDVVPAEDPSARCEILLALGRTLMRAGDADARPTFLETAELARGLADARRLARAALGFGGHYAEAGVVDEPLIALLEEALDALGDADPPLRALLLARLADALMFAGQPERTLELSHRAVEQARGSGDVEALAAALTSRHGAMLHAEHLPARLALSEHMLTLARRAGHRDLEGLAQHRHIYDLVEAGELDRARAEHAELAALGEELRQPLLQHFATGWSVVWASMDGRFEQAQQLAGLCFEYGQRAQSRDAPTQLAGQMLSLQRQREGLGDVIEAIEAALAQYPALVAWHAVLPLAHLDAGNTERARELFEPFAITDFSAIPRDMFWLTGITVLGEACAVLRDAERARTLYDMLAPYADYNVQVGAASCFGSNRRFLGELAMAMREWDTMIDDFERALAANREWKNRPVVALTQTSYATGLVERGAPGDRERADELLREAVATADELGMPVIRRRAANLKGQTL